MHDTTTKLTPAVQEIFDELERAERQGRRPPMSIEEKVEAVLDYMEDAEMPLPTFADHIFEANDPTIRADVERFVQMTKAEHPEYSEEEIKTIATERSRAMYDAAELAQEGMVQQLKNDL